HSMIQQLGSEFDILLNIPVETISDLANERIAEAIKRMRNGDVFVREGFDGEFGRITVFHKNEFSNASCQKPLFKELPSTPSIQKKNTRSHKKKTAKSSPLPDSKHIQKKIHSDIPNGFTESKPRIESKTLNPEQKRAVEHFKGPALIIAGPGTGKTRVLAFRIAHLIQEKKIKPNNILAVTFTNKSALEMKNRLSRLPGSYGSLDQPWISTFHGLGYSILRKYSEKYGRDDCFSIIDEDEKNQILLKRVKCESKQLKGISASITRIKQNLLSETKIADGDGKNIFLQYESVLESLNAFDLDDLISKPVTLLAEFPEIRDDYRSKIKWCLVDEYQDINFAQYQLLQHILPGPDPNYVVIGDPNQAIYGFRGSDVRFITRFKHDYPRASEYILKQSYRCSDHILQASGDIILSLSNTEKNLQGLHEGVKINIIQNSTDKSEAEFMARTIEQMIGGLGFFSMDSQVTEGNEVSEIQSLSDFAVLCRINQQMEVMKKAFQNHLIPFQTVGDTPFLKAEPAKSIIQLIKWLKNPKYSFSENKLIDPNRIQPSSSAPIKFTIDDDYPVTELITKIHDNFIRDQFRNDHMVKKLLDVACKFDNQLEAFLKFVSLGTSMDLYRADIEQVSLMTLHAAKGLEFNCVFIIGCESGLIPYSLFLKTEPDLEEERRLLYVGMTRAKNFLYLSHAKKRTLHGKTYNLPRSPFLDDIEKELLEVTQSRTKKKKNQNGSQLKLFDF
ncbi:MAG: UvrD-helicase domain-containing protein, partial [Candidatus Aminicenantes bacterium]|nr:UvrD-helicase domain-containing protein [Candidatus Aminicenantes bacterium]